ncbi:MAG TPA: DUF3108 domain-containing protein [Bryobacteraceae bacterium]|nr:DUF3108 domain-containing protein [Bryobacteraceae bacterium]
MTRSALHRWASWLACVAVLAPVHSQAPSIQQAQPFETFHLGVEWRLVRAGSAVLTRTPRPGGGWQSDLHIESAGLVSKLFRVNDAYRSQYDSGFCTANTLLRAEEGKRRRETVVTFHHDTKKSSYLERDTIRNAIVMQKELDVPPCVQDVVAALSRLRATKLAPGQSTQFPISDGKRMAMVKIEAQEKETLKTPAGIFQAMRYEAHLFNDVLYVRKGRLFVWLTDDERKLLVQIRVKLSFPVGTISLQLEKIG